MALHVDIISPERPLYSGEAISVTAPAHDGEIGILERHSPMVSKLGVGEVRIKRGSLGGQVDDRFAVRNGFVQTAENKVIIIAEEAVRADDIDHASLDHELSELEKQMAGDLERVERAEASARVAWLKTQKGITQS